MKKIWSGIKKFIGVTAEQEAAKKWRPEPLTSTAAPRYRRWGHKGWRTSSFRRRHPRGPEAKLRAARDKFIADSQRQGVELAHRRREAQLKDRDRGGHLYMQAFRRSTRGI